MSMTATIYDRDGASETLPIYQATHRVKTSPETWSFEPPPPLGWERETPRYKATLDLDPSPNPRHRTERPFSSQSATNQYQYGEGPITAGEIIETKCWPHPSFCALNYSAGRVLDFYTTRQKSRLPIGPFRGNQIALDDGLTGPTDFQPPRQQLQPANLRPVA